MSTSTAPSHLNGNSVVPDGAPREAAFYEKLLRVRDDVYAGKHPRIRLPAKVLEQVSPRPSQTAPPARPTTNGTPNGTAPSLLFPPRPDSSHQQFTSPPNNGVASPVPNGSRPFSAKSTSSGIDPVLLTKSDHLIKAELQLRRQQIERILKDQLDKRPRFDDERELLDVESILGTAQRLVQPVSGLPATATNSDDAESFDDSYYSSKADSWSSSEVDRNGNAVVDASEPLTLQHNHSPKELHLIAPKPAQPIPAAHNIIDLDEEYEPTDDLDIYEPEPAHVHEEADESDYSPPPADIGPSEPRRGRGRERERENNGFANGSRRHSPTGPPPPIQNNRKRKREQKRGVNVNKRVARSPDSVVIKEEPVSPPPFEPTPSRNEPSGGFGGPHSAPRASRYYDEPSSPSAARLPARRLERGDDLRRVASLQSLQYARRPQSPMDSEMYTAPEPRIVRAASHAFAERPAEHAIYREASVRPPGAPRYVRERSHSLGREYLSRPQSPMMMAPPPRTVVMDQFGNKYYAAPSDYRQSVAPSSRMVEVDPYYERAVTREPAMRAPAQAGLYEDDDVFRMPPPPPRRYVEASDIDMVETRPYRREASHRPIEVDYRPSEVVERRPLGQYEEMRAPREYIPSRAFSVRPEMPRREVPEGYVRHESIQPGHVRVGAPRYREVSVHHEAYDDRRASVAAPSSRRYVEDGGLDRLNDGVQESYGAESRAVRYRY
ncbi:hypothetical protein P280DRAFT_40914 [Massarina eburnea CBS 473.64]|uniref:Uncharacterized protein n=1 Tax=Massarina eburnea CBS 473.64 TaxID=1395130 RepID=A0A6A6S046_9PLEO|nr:hypothetical protein P280DRAFT_40914 [Massarina eburnea CBS 473.64]